MSVHIPNENLQEETLPRPYAPWLEISPFAGSFFGYDYWGSTGACTMFANQALKIFREQSVLPAKLSELRSCLFFEQRRKVHQGEDFDEEKMKYLHALVEGIRGKVIRKEFD